MLLYDSKPKDWTMCLSVCLKKGWEKKSGYVLFLPTENSKICHNLSCCTHRYTYAGRVQCVYNFLSHLILKLAHWTNNFYILYKFSIKILLGFRKLWGTTSWDEFYGWNGRRSTYSDIGHKDKQRSSINAVEYIWQFRSRGRIKRKTYISESGDWDLRLISLIWKWGW